MNFDRVVENMIRRAQEEGKFKNLRGKGRPLKLDDNPFEDPAWSLANQMMKDNGFRPDWLEDDLAVREEVERARQALARTRDWRAAQLAALGTRRDAKALEQRELVAHEWQLAQARFRTKLAEVNKAIFHLNLKVPSIRFQRLKLDVEAEMQRVIEARGPGAEGG